MSPGLLRRALLFPRSLPPMELVPSRSVVFPRQLTGSSGTDSYDSRRGLEKTDRQSRNARQCQKQQEL
jgi:hypothetical protein